MKRLIVFVLTLLIAGVTFATGNGSTHYCADLTGSWSLSNTPSGGTGNATLALTQHSDHSISGTVTNYYCAVSATYITLTVNQTFSSWSGSDNGTFTIETNSVSNCTLYDNFKIAEGQIGCQKGNWQSFNSGEAMTRAGTYACEVPGTAGSGNNTGGENASTTGTPAYQGGYNDYAVFYAKLNDAQTAGFNFSGREVQEFLTDEAPASPAPTAECPGWAEQSPRFGPAPWYPDTDNYSVGTPGPDGIGEKSTAAGVAAIKSVQQNYSATLPCTMFYTQQQMTIDCDNGSGGITWTVYETHPIYFIIGDGYIDSVRNGTDAGNNSWGLTRFQLRNLDTQFYRPFFPIGTGH